MDGLVKVAFGLVSLGLVGAVKLLWNTVSVNRDAVRDLRRESATREQHLALEARVSRLEDDKVTTDCVREVIEEALEKREREAEKRREERAKRYELQTRETVREEITKAFNRHNPRADT